MSTEAHQGPSWAYGDMEAIAAAFGAALPDPNPDAAPSVSFQGGAFPDVRFFLSKNKLNGFGGVQPAFLESVGTYTTDAVPSAYGAAKIAAAAHTVNGTAMTLVTTAAAGISINIPIVPFTGMFNGLALGTSPTIAPIVLDFGFAFGTTTASSKTVTVADSTQFWIGMPLVIAGVGATATTALLTWVTGAPTATTITINDAATQAVTGAAIGTGNIWPGAPLSTASQAYPTAHYPYLAAGPAALFDPQQAITRGVSITTAVAGAGGAFKVSGWDVFWQPMNETITATAGTGTVYGKKAFKAIKSVTPQFTDATGTYSVGTSDVFGFNMKARRYELIGGAWAAGFLTGAAGFTPYTTPANGDVRGTFQASAIGGGTGFGATASSGVITSLVMTGNRLCLYQNFSVTDTIQATARTYAGFGPSYLFGATQT